MRTEVNIARKGLGKSTDGVPSAYNDGYTHEALHTAHVLIDTWDQHVVETRCCDQFPDVKEVT